MNDTDETIARLYAEHAGSVFAYCRARFPTFDREDCKELVNEVFFRASRHLHELRDPARLRGWLIQIASRACLRRIARRDRIKRHLDRLALSIETVEEPIASGDLEEALRLEQAKQWLLTVGLEALSPREREVISRVMEGHSRAEIAARLGMTLPNVRVHHHNALIKLKQAWRDLEAPV